MVNQWLYIAIGGRDQNAKPYRIEVYVSGKTEKDALVNGRKATARVFHNLFRKGDKVVKLP